MSPPEEAQAPSSAALGVVLALGVSAISASAIFIRMAEAPGLSTAAARTLLSAALMLLIALLGPGRRRWRMDRRELGLCVTSGVFLGLHFWSWMTSLEYTSVASSVLFVTLNPIFVGLAAPFVTRDKLTGRLWAGIALAMVGSAVVGYDDLAQGPGGSLLGNGLALLGSVCASGYLLAGRLARRTVSLEWYAVTTNTAAALLLLPLVWIMGAPLWSLPAPTWGMFLLIAAVPQLIGHNSLVWALRHVSAPVVALVILAEPIGSGALAWWIFEERPSLLKLLGAALLLSGIFLASARSAAASEEH